jgi:hypothetical protein
VAATTALATAPPEPAPALLNVPLDLVESMSEDELVGLLLLRMRALLARGLEPGEAMIAAARLRHVRV